MSILDKILKENPEKLIKTLAKLKQYKKNRNDFYQSKEYANKYIDFTKDLKKQDGWSKDRTMKKTFSVPMEIYMTNTDYWDKVFKSKELQKRHPEWQVG